MLMLPITLQPLPTERCPGGVAPRPGFAMLSTIRFLVAKHLNFAFCTDFNKNILKKQGLSDEDIEEMTKDPLKAPLEDYEQAMLGFVMKAIKSPDAV